MSSIKKIRGVQRVTVETFSSGGPGGMHQNKTSSGVRLRATISGKRLLERLRMLFPGKITKEGELLVESRDERNQAQNRNIAWRKLLEIIRAGRKRPKQRVATKPTRASNNRRLQAKKARKKLKQLRNKPSIDEQ